MDGWNSVGSVAETVAPPAPETDRVAALEQRVAELEQRVAELETACKRHGIEVRREVKS